jgi:hypothetical protein
LSQKYEMKGNFISAFQDEIKEKIDTGEWEEATQTQILISMTEMAQGLFPTYESKRASLVAAAKIKIGPDQYTPLAFKDLYMVEVQEEINAHLATMNQAITNQDRNSFLVGQGSMAALAVEMGSDADDISLTIHPHPTLGETFASAAEVYLGTITDLYIPSK